MTTFRIILTSLIPIMAPALLLINEADNIIENLHKFQNQLTDPKGIFILYNFKRILLIGL